jgi:hypothetical protein
MVSLKKEKKNNAMPYKYINVRCGEGKVRSDIVY